MITRTAKRIDDVIPLLDFADREARSGSHVAVMLSYEAAPAFDSAFVTHEPSDFPLAWAAVLGEPADEELELYSSTTWIPQVNRDEYDRSVSRILPRATGRQYRVATRGQVPGAREPSETPRMRLRAIWISSRVPQMQVSRIPASHPCHRVPTVQRAAVRA